MEVIKCEKCNGKGYIFRLYNVLTEKQGTTQKQVARVYCDECRGRGRKVYEGDRSGIEWEGE